MAGKYDRHKAPLPPIDVFAFTKEDRRRMTQGERETNERIRRKQIRVIKIGNYNNSVSAH